MRKNLREVRDMLTAEGFRVERVDLNTHAKFHLERDGVRFFIVVSNSPSDKLRWLHRILQSAKRTLQEKRNKPAAGVSGNNRGCRHGKSKGNAAPA